MKAYKPLLVKEGKVTFFELNKIKTFNKNSFLDKLRHFVGRVIYDPQKNIIGGTQKDTLKFIKEFLKEDEEAAKELGISYPVSKEHMEDIKYLKSIK